MKFSLLLLKGQVNLNTHKWFRGMWQKGYSWPQFSSENCTECPPPIVTDQAVNQIRNIWTRKLDILHWMANSDNTGKSALSRDAVSYEQFDLFVADLNENDLFDMARVYQIGNHHLSAGMFPKSPFTPPPRGKIILPNQRFMISLPCRRVPDGEILNVWFLVDIGAPYTAVSCTTLSALYGNRSEPADHFFLNILDPHIEVGCHISKAHFSDLNLLGTNALEELQLTPVADWGNKTFVLAKIKLSIFARFYVVG